MPTTPVFRQSRRPQRPKSWTESAPHPLVLWKRIVAVFTPTERMLWRVGACLWVVSSVVLIVLSASNHLVRVPAAGGEYREGLVGFPQYPNPLFAIANPVDRDLVRLLFTGLLKPNLDSHGPRFIPDLAQSVTIDASQKEYRITLRPNLQWPDGKPLTTDDVVFTIESILNADWKSPLAVSFKGVTVQKLDDRMMLLNLPEPFSHFQEALTVGILPKHLWSNVTNPRLTELNTKPVGSGPYRFSSIAKDKQGAVRSYTLERNPFYHDRRAFLNKIILTFYPDYNATWKALEAQEIDGLGFLPQQYQRNPLAPPTNNHAVLKAQLPQLVSVFFNAKTNPLLAERTVRRALNLAIDRNTLVDTVFAQGASLVAGPLLQGMPGYDPKLPLPKQDLGGAEKLLDESGWKRMNAEELIAWRAKQEASQTPPASSTQPPELPQGLPYYRVKGNQELALKLTVVDRTESMAVGAFMEQWWKSIGVEVTLKGLSGEKIVSDSINQRQYEVLLYGQLFGAQPDPFPFWHSSQLKAPGLNIAQWSDKRVDSILEKARKSADDKERAALYKEFQTILIDNAAALFLYSPYYTYVFPQAVRGNTLTTIAVPSDRFARAAEWYRRTRLAWRWSRYSVTGRAK